MALVALFVLMLLLMLCYCVCGRKMARLEEYAPDNEANLIEQMDG